MSAILISAQWGILHGGETEAVIGFVHGKDNSPISTKHLKACNEQKINIPGMQQLRDRVIGVDHVIKVVTVSNLP